MTSYQIEEYLNSLPDNTTELYLISKNLTYIPDLSRFKQLIILNCSDNQLTALPPLNDSLIELCCNNNQITHLPMFNINLKYLYCINNKITELPPLNKNLKRLLCQRNKIKRLPLLNENLHYLDCDLNELTTLPPLNQKLKILRCRCNNLKSLPNIDMLEFIEFDINPIFTIIYDRKYKYNPCEELEYYENDETKLCINKLKKNIRIINEFRKLYYTMKFKQRFREWLWVKIREPKIKEYYHPSNLLKLLENIDDENDEELDEILENW